MPQGLTGLPRTHFGGIQVQTADLATGVIAATTAGRALIADDAIRQGKLDRRYIFEEFKTRPLACLASGGAPSGTTGAVNLLGFPENTLEHLVIGAGQTILVPTLGANGLDISQDQTASEGCELCAGITTRSPGRFVVGTDAAFFMQATFTVADASGAAILLAGFRKSEAYQTDYNNYDELVSIGILGSANPNTIFLSTILNNAATVNTNTTNTWADGATKTLKVLVSAAGVVTYQIDGAAPSTVAAFTFDAAESVTPFVTFLHSADVAGAVELSLFECGLQ